MDVPQARWRIWSPHVIIFSVVLHAVIIYYIASAFHIVPPIIPTEDPPTIPITYTPPTPPEPDPEPITKQPIFHPKPTPSPIASPVEPIPLAPTTPTTNPSPGVQVIGAPVPEEPVSKALPLYPQVAINKEVEGRVRLSITIMPDGTVRDVVVVSARPRGYFEEAAIRAVRTWRYRQSNVIRTNVIVDIDFVLRG